MRIACLVPKDTNTHSEYVILMLLRGNRGYTKALASRFTYIACLVIFENCLTSWSKYVAATEGSSENKAYFCVDYAVIVSTLCGSTTTCRVKGYSVSFYF